jgi:low affinity Fe/Cu permease
MVFLIQKSANKDSMAIQLKLNELIACHKAASNRVIDIESLSEQDLESMHTFYAHLASLSQHGRNIYHVYSLDIAEDNHKQKQQHHEKAKINTDQLSD